MKKIKILHFLPSWEQGGAERWLLKFIEQFALDDRFENHVGAIYPVGKMRSEFLKLNVPIVEMNIKRKYDLFKIFSFRKFLKTSNYDFIHTHLLKTDLLFILLGYGLKVKFLTTKHNNFYKANWKNKYIENIINKRFDHVFCVSTDIRNAVEKKGNLDTVKIEVVNPVHLHLDDMVQLISRPIHRPLRIGTLGRLHPVKGLRYLIKALAEVKLQNVEVKLYIAGPNSHDHKKQLLKIVDKEKLETSIVWLGAIDDINAYFNQIDIFCITSISEGFPLSVIEAMSQGKPIIGSAVGGILDQVKNDKNGFLTEVGDVDAIARAILMFAKNDKLIEKMGRESFKRVKSKFSIEKSVDQIRERYMRLYTNG